MEERHHHSISDIYLCELYKHSNLTQWKRAGLITLKSLDRNQELLMYFSQSKHVLIGRRAF